MNNLKNESIIEMKSIALYRTEMSMRSGSCAGGLDQRDVPISHMQKKIRECLCDKIIAA